MTMRFYSGVVDDVNHHDIALVEQKALLPEPPAEWSMYKSNARDQPHRDHLPRS